MNFLNRYILPIVLTAFGLAPYAWAQESLTERERLLLDRVEKLEQRLFALEAKAPATVSPKPVLTETVPAPLTSQATAQATAPVIEALSSTKDSSSLPGFLAGTTLNFNFDGYYGYNTNRPIGRVNLLRAYDVSSNSFSINQAGIVIERAPDVSVGRRLGYRMDLMFGQATDTLQGSSVNEPRPQIYRNLFQAYGSYIAPLGTGLQLDFGKFASSLGYENNYTKDQMNYSRSYLFNYLPFYHNGARATYKLNDKVTAQYWLVNGANQTEDFNGFKSNAFLFTITPNKTVNWQVNYYFGQEGRDLAPAYNPALPALPTQPGLSTTRLYPRPDGKEHIFDTYLNWNATPKLTLAAEGDYVVNRTLHNDSPSRVVGGAAYARYQIAPLFALAGRFEYLNDHGGLFSGTTQRLKESTVTATFQPIDGFQFRAEYRRDFSNRYFFLTSQDGVLKRQQNTATLGLIWWFGGKQGAW
jgi:hypothetical protein